MNKNGGKKKLRGRNEKCQDESLISETCKRRTAKKRCVKGGKIKGKKRMSEEKTRKDVLKIKRKRDAKEKKVISI